MLHLWVYCSHSPSVGWRVCLQATHIDSNCEEIFTHRQVLKKGEIPNCSSSNGFDPNAMTMTKLSAGFTATYSRVNNAVGFFKSVELLFFSLSYLLTAMDGSMFLLGPCQVLVMHSFAFSFRLSKVRSLIGWLLRSFCVQREKPMLRILNSLSSCCDVDMLLQGKSVIWPDVFFFPPDQSQRSPVRFAGVPSCNCRWVVSVFF